MKQPTDQSAIPPKPTGGWQAHEKTAGNPADAQAGVAGEARPKASPSNDRHRAETAAEDADEPPNQDQQTA